MRVACERGQATVESVALAPVVLLCCLLGLQALVAGANFVVASHVAHSAALAGQMGRDVKRAARAAAPGWSTGRLEVSDRARRVTVRLRPRTIVPGLAPVLSVEAGARYTR
jgi:pilus assembly protein CpaE